MADRPIYNQPILTHRVRDTFISQQGNKEFQRKIDEFLSLDMVPWDDEFLGDTLHGGYQSVTDAGTALTITAPTSASVNGKATMVTAASNDDSVITSLGLNYTGNRNAVFACLLSLNSIADVKLEMGWHDQTAATGGAASDNSGAAVAVLATPTATATDAAVWVFDTDDTGNAAWQGFSVFNGATPQKQEPTNIGNYDGDAAPNVDILDLLIVALQGQDDDGGAGSSSSVRFLRGGMSAQDSSEEDYTKRLQITYDSGWVSAGLTSTVALTPHLHLQARTGTAKTLTIERFSVWGYRHIQENAVVSA